MTTILEEESNLNEVTVDFSLDRSKLHLQGSSPKRTRNDLCPPTPSLDDLCGTAGAQPGLIHISENPSPDAFVRGFPDDSEEISQSLSSEGKTQRKRQSTLRKSRKQGILNQVKTTQFKIDLEEQEYNPAAVQLRTNTESDHTDGFNEAIENLFPRQVADPEVDLPVLDSASICNLDLTPTVNSKVMSMERYSKQKQLMRDQRSPIGRALRDLSDIQAP